MLLPVQDEMVGGHEGRCVTPLGFQSRKELRHWLRDQHMAQEPGESAVPPTLHLIAKAVGMTPEKYARSHSMLGLLRVAARRNRLFPHGSPQTSSITKRWGMEVLRGGAYFCNACIEEELSKWPHCSVWHRSHHVDGVDWCLRHGLVLWRVNAPQAFDETPLEWQRSGQATPLDACSKTLPPDGIIRRYAEISVGLLEEPKPAVCYELNRAILRRATHLSMAKEGVAHWLIDRMRAVDTGWQHPGINELRAGRYPFASGTRGAQRGDVYALMLAAVCESKNEALELVHDAGGQKSNPQSRSETTKPCSLQGDEAWFGTLWTEFVEAKGNVLALHRKIGGARSNLNVKLNLAGLTSLHGLGVNPRWNAVVEFRKGLPLQEAISITGADPCEVEDLLRTGIARLAWAIELVLENRVGQPERG